MPKVFLILGSKGSGKKEILFNLLNAGYFEDQQKAIFISHSDAEDEWTSKLKTCSSSDVFFWQLNDGAILNCPSVSDAEWIFVIADGFLNPVDQLEIWKDFFVQKGWNVSRILTTVDCRLISNPELVPWFDACIHFSDAVLLNHRKDVTNAGIKRFLDKYRDECYPCLFEYVKNGKLDHWEVVFNSEARRISSTFDDLAETYFDTHYLEDIESSFDLDEEEGSGTDKYFERRGDGVRKITLPCIKRFLKNKS